MASLRLRSRCLRTLTARFCWVSAECFCTYDKVVQVLGNLRSKTLALENTQDLVTSDRAHLGHTVAVTELSTDLRRSNTLTSELNDLLDDLLWRSLEPGRRVAAVRESRLADTLTVRCRSASLLTEPLTVHATHDVCQVKRNVSALHAPNFPLRARRQAIAPAALSVRTRCPGLGRSAELRPQSFTKDQSPHVCSKIHVTFYTRNYNSRDIPVARGGFRAVVRRSLYITLRVQPSQGWWAVDAARANNPDEAQRCQPCYGRAEVFRFCGRA